MSIFRASAWIASPALLLIGAVAGMQYHSALGIQALLGGLIGAALGITAYSALAVCLAAVRGPSVRIFSVLGALAPLMVGAMIGALYHSTIGVERIPGILIGIAGCQILLLCLASVASLVILITKWLWIDRAENDSPRTLMPETQAQKMTPRSRAFEAIHSAATDLHEAGLIDKATMRGFDQSCLYKGFKMIKNIALENKNERVERQILFDNYLGLTVARNNISDAERDKLIKNTIERPTRDDINLLEDIEQWRNGK